VGKRQWTYAQSSYFAELDRSIRNRFMERQSKEDGNLHGSHSASGDCKNNHNRYKFRSTDLQMLRAAGRFKRSSYPTVDVTEEDEGAALDEKWKQWADLESYKRFVSPSPNYSTVQPIKEF
jgi:hypothetical protein